jgi:hypothetical protein
LVVVTGSCGGVGSVLSYMIVSNKACVVVVVTGSCGGVGSVLSYMTVSNRACVVVVVTGSCEVVYCRRV